MTTRLYLTKNTNSKLYIGNIWHRRKSKLLRSVLKIDVTFAPALSTKESVQVQVPFQMNG